MSSSSAGRVDDPIGTFAHAGSAASIGDRAWEGEAGPSRTAKLIRTNGIREEKE
jgi:hypothetical protein